MYYDSKDPICCLKMHGSIWRQTFVLQLYCFTEGASEWQTSSPRAQCLTGTSMLPSALPGVLAQVPTHEVSVSRVQLGTSGLESYFSWGVQVDAKNKKVNSPMCRIHSLWEKIQSKGILIILHRYRLRWSIHILVAQARARELLPTLGIFLYYFLMNDTPGDKESIQCRSKNRVFCSVFTHGTVFEDSCSCCLWQC